MRHAVAAAVAVPVLLAGTGCGGGSESGREREPGLPRPGQAQTVAAGLGTGSTAVTVGEVVETGPEAGFLQPPSGSDFLTVQVDVVNTGDVSAAVSPSTSTTLIDSSGERLEADPAFTPTDLAAMPIDSTIPPGEKATFLVGFVVPTGTDVVEVDFVSDSGLGDPLRWDVS